VSDALSAAPGWSDQVRDIKGVWFSAEPRALSFCNRSAVKAISRSRLGFSPVAWAKLCAARADV